MKRLGKNIAANLLSNIWSTALSLLLVPVYVGFLGVESFGLIGFYASWIAILGILDTGISATAGREIAWKSAREDEGLEIPSLVRSLEVVYISIVGCIGLCLLIGVYFWGEYWFQSEQLAKNTIRDALLLMSLSLIFQVPSGLFIGGLMGLQKQVECSTILAVMSTIRGLGTVLALWLVVPDIRVYFIWNIVASALQTLWLRFSLWKYIKKENAETRFSFKLLNSVKYFAGGMIIITCVSVVISQGDKMILSSLVTLESLGVYMVAVTVASGLSRVSTPLVQAFQPRLTEMISRNDKVESEQLLRGFSQVMNFLMFFPATLLYFFAEPVLALWTQNADLSTEAAPLLGILVYGGALGASAYPFLSVLYASKNLKPVIFMSSIGLFVFIPMLYFFTFYHGVKGAAIFAVVSAGSMFLIYSFYVYRTFAAYTYIQFFKVTISDFIFPIAFMFALTSFYHMFLSQFSLNHFLIICWMVPFALVLSGIIPFLGTQTRAWLITYKNRI